MTEKKRYNEQVYAGVLGKIIGVYLGRPVEGWSYPAIRERFGEVRGYIHRELDMPLIVPDDDISGTFAFFRATEDYDIAGSRLCARQIGDTWLNYIIENRTILWWGGLGVSSEHTAYLRLKSGVPAPESGSEKLNGRGISNQIGAQIFMDAYAMMCPGDPEEAAYYVRQAASVSHDGLAVDAACFLGAMEALAFDEPRLDKLFDECARIIHTPEIEALVKEVREVCARSSDWRAVREWLEQNHGYHLYPGNCHMIPNHALVLASLLMGGDSFEESLAISVSAGWDTDCNAGNVGCLNGIRLGLSGIGAGIDYRTEVADRLLAVSADGGECISDAVLQTRKILAASARLSGQEPEIPEERFGFEFPGATQGFIPCPVADLSPGLTILGSESAENPGLRLRLDGSGPGFVSTATFLDFPPASGGYGVAASPTLYSGQTVRVCAKAVSGEISLTPYICVSKDGTPPEILLGEPAALSQEPQTLEWKVPCSGSNGIIYRFGLKLSGGKGEALVRSVDWSGTPTITNFGGTLAFVSSADVFRAESGGGFTIIQNRGQGLAAVGTRDFTDYEVSASVKMSLHSPAGLVARSRGLRRYYSAVLHDGGCLSVRKQLDSETVTLGAVLLEYREFTPYRLFLRVKNTENGCEISAGIGDTVLLRCFDSDPRYASGAAGLLVEDGYMLAEDFALSALD